MTRKQRAQMAVDTLKRVYPDAMCSLEYQKPYELLIATRLSAQCTDARVNIVTRELFTQYPTLESLAEAPLEEIERIIHSCGLYKTKARDILGICRMLLDEYQGVVPDSIEALTRLPGVGRKTASLIMGDVYHQPAVVTDTHCIRICNRLGLVSEDAPYKVELALKKILPPEESSDFCHRLVLFGREYCRARGPRCEECPCWEFCPTYRK
ncbi:MAG TPA: endonuclease III [Firmicutes bacterium]|nr:endonuclease III [Bacillota bacterium]